MSTFGPIPILIRWIITYPHSRGIHFVFDLASLFFLSFSLSESVSERWFNAVSATEAGLAPLV